MPESQYPSVEEFWRRLERRRTEADLRAVLWQRVRREEESPSRLPAAIVVAVAARLLPGAVPPEALAVFVDQHFDLQLGRGDDQSGVLPRGELIAVGFATLEETARRERGCSFAEAPAEQQDALLLRAGRGELSGPDGFDAATWFKRTRGLLFLGYGSDPRGMVEMGFPGPSYQSGHVWLDEGE